MLSSELIRQMETLARDAALKAGELIRNRLGAPASVEKKAMSDYVTDVDRESEALIVEMIRKRFPDHNILSEEMSSTQLHRGITWIIDPLDGTTNFIHGYPVVAISMAACLEEETLLGIVLDPIHQEFFWAKKGAGAFLNGKRIGVRQVSSLEEALVGTGFPFRFKHLMDPYVAAFKRIFLQVTDIRRAGSAALDLAYVAAGRLDGFWELGLSTWDVAAGALLIQEAGGMVSDFWGRQDYIGNGHIVAGSPRVYPFLFEHARIFLAPSLESALD